MRAEVILSLAAEVLRWAATTIEGVNHSDITTIEEETMKITRIDRRQARHDPSRANFFDGEVNIQTLVSPADSNELDLLTVYFSAGARTRPHIHEQDQVLHIIEGQGIVATETEKQVVSAGDVITVPAGTWHWHGATRTSAMGHISVMKRGKTNWTVEEKNWATGYDE